MGVYHRVATSRCKSIVSSLNLWGGGGCGEAPRLGVGLRFAQNKDIEAHRCL